MPSGSQYIADPAIEARHHAVGLWMAGPDQAVFDCKRLALTVKQMLAGWFALSLSSKTVSKGLTVIRQDDLDMTSVIEIS